jgi:starch synthase
VHVAHIAPEVAPFAKVGGLGDVAGALPPAQALRGHEVTVVLPGYRQVWSRLPERRDAHVVAYRLGGREVFGAAVEVEHRGVRLLVLAHDAFFDRPGVYGEQGGFYADNGARFGWFAGAALVALRALARPPDVVLAHDWPAALAPLYLRAHGFPGDPLAGCATAMVLHNLAHQGAFPLELAHWLHVPGPFLHEHALEALGGINLLKGGIATAASVITVSPTYAREILDPPAANGLEAVLRRRAGSLHGILNGIDVATWDPAQDPHLPARFEPGDLAGKARCKASLQAQLGLAPEPDRPLLGMVSRIDAQKGVDLLAAAAPRLLDAGAQIALLGTGQRALLEPLLALAQVRQRQLAVIDAFDEALAHRIYAGADFFLMPSRFEPCGLGQLVALRYGTVPIARHTGGLADTVRDADEDPAGGNGFLFDAPEPAAFGDACERALGWFAERPADLLALVRRGMQEDHSWNRSAATYDRVLEEALSQERPGGAPSPA